MSDNAHVENTANAIKNLVEPYTLELTSDITYLSSGDICNLTATLTDLNDDPVAGELLYYKIMDSTGADWDEGTILTDDNGVAEFSYSDIAGCNVIVHVYGRMFLHKTCELIVGE